MKRISYLLLFLLLHILLLTGCQGINNETNSSDSGNEKLDEYANGVTRSTPKTVEITDKSVA